MRLAVLAIGLWATSALASADTFGVGDGHSGPLDLSACTGNAYVNEYTPLSSIAGGGLVLNVGSAANFAASDLVMVWQPAAMAPGTVPSGAQAPFVLAGNTGAFELGRVMSKTATSLTLSAPLLNLTFVHAQVVRVPELAGLKLGALCTLAPGSRSASTPQPWDGTVGGVVAFFSDDSLPGALSTNIAGVISADGAGFQDVAVQASSGATNCGSTDNLTVSNGGSFRGESVTSATFSVDVKSGFGNIANAGGGGNCTQSAGGGGSNAALGGLGGAGLGLTTGGLGGAPIAWRNINAPTDALYSSQAAVVNGSLVTRFTFGGGGGHGQTVHGQGTPGGRGGGVVFIRANHLAGTGAIHANGVSGAPLVVPDADGQGGGGGGGTLIVRLEGALGIPCANIQARGGAGVGTSSAGVGAGGGGSGGRVLIQSTTSCAVSDVSGGAGGLANGGLSGIAGASGSREAIPGGAYCRDSTSDALCTSIDATKPHCNATFGFCAECQTDTQCTSPDKPRCDLYNGVCTCTANSDCPAAAPVCNAAARTCQSTCDTNGGDAFCSAQFGSSPGNTRFCELNNVTGKKGQCAPCLSNSSACPLAQPICTADACTGCDATTQGQCMTAHGGLQCDTLTGACVQCLTAASCSGTQGCVTSSCGACTTDATCTGSTAGSHCVSGACAQCATAADCSGGKGCVSHQCSACSGDATCSGSPSGSHCVAGACVLCASGADCVAGQGCVNQMCGACTNNAACTGNSSGGFCVGGACVGCGTAADCSSGQGCVGHVCTACTTDATCSGNGAGSFCVGGACVSCRTGSDCATTQGCVAGMCGACSGDTSCASGLHCTAGVCAACATNVDCTAAATPECQAGNCIGCIDNTGCVGHTLPNCELANATAPALVGTCVACRSDADCAGGQRCDAATASCVDVPDAGAADAGAADAGAVDAGVVDAGAVDAGVVDAGVVDAGMDAGASMADAGSDAGAPEMDAGSSDAGMEMTSPGGCGCGSAEGLWGLLALGLLRRRRASRTSRAR